MGIFDDEVKKIAGEAADDVRSAARQEDERNEIARNVSRDLLSDLSSHLVGVEVSVFKNEVTFTTQAPRRTFKIFCEGPDAFRVKETTGFQTAGRSGEPSPYSDRNVIDRSKMARWVIARLRELRAA